MDARVEAVRNDEKVGRNSMSTFDMCYTDAELVEYLDEVKVNTPKQAVKYCRRMEKIIQDCD